ncbi:hypothetical protein [Paenibacillus sp. Y412MC10]|uniref:hypothetical protein n=1 Tax=Geobacillus sp. (strain Y412MC10) TaxID=481743 RepID=UPI0011A306AE|nr:hypothetical protein [Paenibacillus sp. Y412MC10]
MNIPNQSHLNALYVRLSHERSRLDAAKTEQEREIRGVWVKGIEKEIESEKQFLGLTDTETNETISDDDLLYQLLS